MAGDEPTVGGGVDEGERPVEPTLRTTHHTTHHNPADSTPSGRMPLSQRPTLRHDSAERPAVRHGSDERPAAAARHGSDERPAARHGSDERPAARHGSDERPAATARHGSDQRPAVSSRHATEERPASRYGTTELPGATGRHATSERAALRHGTAERLALDEDAVLDGRVPWYVGDLVTGRYEIERRLGGGSMGDVFLAEDRLLKKPVALKVLRPELAQNRDTVRRFLREVALAHSVTHQNVVRIYDTGEERGLPFFTMEVLQGQVLDELLEGPDGKPVHTAERMPIRKIRSIAFDVLDAMEAAHRAGVVHRDLKPGNVMLTHRGAIVMDFGVAGIDDIDRTADPQSTSSLRSLVRTEVGTIFGSPAYMAPELWEGQAATVQSDLYAFGVMLYQMLTGRLPFSAKTPAAFVEKLSTAPPPPLRSLRRDVPWNLVRLVRRCMARDPELRPTSAANAANLISPLRGRQRRRFAWGAAGVSALLVGALWFRATPSWRDLGLPDTLAEAELAAAVRSFDVGERAAALRRLDRLAVRAPDSAALAFWRATVLHDMGDPRGRLARCGGPEPRGSATWIEMAEAACEPTYRIADPGQQTLDDGPRSVGRELLPLAVQWSLLPQLDAEPSNPEVLSLAETVLDRMSEEPTWENNWATPVRWRLARDHLAVAVGSAPPKRTPSDEDESIADAPALLEGQALRALLDGDEQTAGRLAGKLRPLDPTFTVRRQMHDGKMEDAWASIEALGDDDPFAPSLLSMWCGYALRFEMPSRPQRCAELPPGLPRALWDVREGRPADVGELDEGSAAVVKRYAAVEAGRCVGADKRPPRLRPLAAPFETFAAEIELTAALCPASASVSDPKRANELADALVALSPNDPWVLVAAAHVDDDDPNHEKRAEGRRLAASERWANADNALPLVARLRDELGMAPSKPAAPQVSARTP